MKYWLIICIYLFSPSSVYAKFIVSDIDLERYEEMRKVNKDSPLYYRSMSILENRVAGIYYTLQWVNSREQLILRKKTHYCMPFKTYDLDVNGILEDLDNEVKYNKDYHAKMMLTDAVVLLLMQRNKCSPSLMN